MATVRNDRSGEVINDELTHAQAAELFLQEYGDREHWLHFWLHRYAANVRRTQQVTAPQIANERAQGQAAQQFIADLFLLATGRGLKRPMIRLHFHDRRFKIYLSARGTVCFKSGALTAPAEDGSRDPVGDEEYMGCLFEGRFVVARNDTYRGRYNGYDRNESQRVERPLLPVEREFLDNLLGPSPIPFMAQCSRDMDRCCYCNQPLDDVRSKTLGYGKTCAAHWGLPWGHAKDVQHAPSFASIYDGTIAGFCAAIREQPDDPNRWAVFNDYLTERGLPPLKIVEQAEGTGLWVLKFQPFRMARTN